MLSCVVATPFQSLARDLHLHGCAGDPVNGIMTPPWLCFAARGIALRALWAVEQDPRLFFRDRRPLIRPQRHHGIGAGRASRRQPARKQHRPSEQSAGDDEHERISRLDPDE